MATRQPVQNEFAISIAVVLGHMARCFYTKGLLDQEFINAIHEQIAHLRPLVRDLPDGDLYLGYADAFENILPPPCEGV